MKRTIVLQIVLVLVFALSLSAQAGMTAYPFLLIGTSLSGNGMGEIRGTLNNGSTLQATFNPGLLGIHSIDHSFSAEFYTQRVAWMRFLSVPNLTFTSSALSAQVPFSNAPDDPYPATIGVGWSSSVLNLGDWILTDPDDPLNPIRSNIYERVDGISAGLGIEYGGRYGFGLTIKNIVSALPPIGTAMEHGSGKVTNIAIDLGFFAEVPVISEHTFAPLQTGSVLFLPDLSFSGSYNYRNIGGMVTFHDPAQRDPLPREIVMGISLSGGIATELQNIRLPLVSFIAAREASDIAVVRSGPNDWSYQYGIGDIDPVNHLLFGRSSSFGTVSKGSSFSFAGLFTILEGSNIALREPFHTEGRVLHLHGIFPYLQLLIPPLRESTVFSFVAAHLQFDYVQSSYSSSSGSMLHGTRFEGFTAAWR